MQGTFRLMEGDSHIGNFIIDSEKDVWVYQPVGDYEPQPLLFKSHIKRHGKAEIHGSIVRDWIVERAPEPTYEFIDALMVRVGISKYDPLAFVMYNGGKFNKDTYYLESI